MFGLWYQVFLVFGAAFFPSGCVLAWVGAWRIGQLPDRRFPPGWDGDGQRIAADQESRRRGGTFRTSVFESERVKIQFVCGGGIIYREIRKDV